MSHNSIIKQIIWVSTHRLDKILLDQNWRTLKAQKTGSNMKASSSGLLCEANWIRCSSCRDTCMNHLKVPMNILLLFQDKWTLLYNISYSFNVVCSASVTTWMNIPQGKVQNLIIDLDRRTLFYLSCLETRDWKKKAMKNSNYDLKKG